MGLPERVFYTVQEASVRWECRLTDLGGWAAKGHFAIVTTIASHQSRTQRFDGFFAISVGDIMPLLRQGRRALVEVPLGRVRPLEQEIWIEFAPGSDDAPNVHLEDLLILAEDVYRFEAEHDLSRRPTAGVGAPKRYDWESMYAAQIVRIHNEGLPESQTAWVAEIQEWFASEAGGVDVPDERTIRRRLAPIWKALTQT